MDAPPETGTPLLPEDISDDREPARPERLPSRKENGPQERLGRADSSGDGDRLAGTDPEQTKKISVLPDPEGRMPERPEITPVLAGRVLPAGNFFSGSLDPFDGRPAISVISVLLSRSQKNP